MKSLPLIGTYYDKMTPIFLGTVYVSLTNPFRGSLFDV